MPPRFAPNANYDVETDTSLSVQDLLESQATLSDQLAEAAAKVAQVNQAVMEGGRFEEDTREQMWDALRNLHIRLAALDDSWNELAPRANA